MDTEAYKLRPATALPFEVRFGFRLCEKVAFAEFDFALAFYRGYLRCQNHSESRGYDVRDDGPMLVNVDNIDGAEDSGAASQRGLTQEQFDAVETVDS